MNPDNSFNFTATIQQFLQYVKTASAVLQRSPISPSQKSKYEETLKRIVARCTDPNMYLAVIGEFNSGKSTFINSLLRDALMRTAPFETTSNATRFFYGDRLEAEVQVAGARKPLRVTEENVATLDRKLLPAANGAGLREFITRITSVSEYADNLTRISVWHPSPFLKNNIVLIDTPGTATQIAGHEEITRAILAEEADAAIVMLPAGQAGSNSQLQFVEETIKPFIHRCFFLVTKITHVEEQHRGELLRRVRARLAERFGLENPTLLVSPPLDVLQDVSGQQRLPVEQEGRRESFSALEAAILERLRRDRTLSITEGIMRLLTDLLRQMLAHLQRRLGEFEALEGEIKAAVLPDLKRFARLQHETAREAVQDEIDRSEGTLSSMLDRYESELSSDIRSAIRSCSSATALRNVDSRCQEIAKRENSSFTRRFAKELAKIESAAEEAAGEFNEAFWREYERLGRLSLADLYVASPEAPSFEVENDFTFYEVEADETLTFSLVADLEEWLGVFFMPSFMLERAKQTMLDKVGAEIRGECRNVRNKAQRSFKEYCTQTLSALEEHIDEHIEKYEETVGQINGELRKRRRAMEQEREQVNLDCAEIEKCLRSLKNLERKLKAL